EVVSGAVNRFECTSCGFEGQIEKPLLYEDPHRGIALYVAPREWRGDPAMEQAARADASRLLESSIDESALGADPSYPPEIPIVYGYPALARRLLAADALELFEDVLIPDTPGE